MGYTPRHKLQKIEDFLKDFADVVFIQDSIDVADITPVLESVSEGGYDFHFSTQQSDVRGGGGGKWEGEADRSITGIAWNKAKYLGTPLQMGDSEVEKYVEWLQRHDVLTGIYEMSVCSRDQLMECYFRFRPDSEARLKNSRQGLDRRVPILDRHSLARASLRGCPKVPYM